MGITKNQLGIAAQSIITYFNNRTSEILETMEVRPSRYILGWRDVINTSTDPTKSYSGSNRFEETLDDKIFQYDALGIEIAVTADFANTGRDTTSKTIFYYKTADITNFSSSYTTLKSTVTSSLWTCWPDSDNSVKIGKYEIVLTLSGTNLRDLLMYRNIKVDATTCAALPGFTDIATEFGTKRNIKIETEVFGCNRAIMSFTPSGSK